MLGPTRRTWHFWTSKFHLDLPGWSTSFFPQKPTFLCIKAIPHFTLRILPHKLMPVLLSIPSFQNIASRIVYRLRILFNSKSCWAYPEKDRFYIKIISAPKHLYLQWTGEYCEVQFKSVRLHKRRDIWLDHVSWSHIIHNSIRLNPLTGVYSPRIWVSMCYL